MDAEDVARHFHQQTADAFNAAHAAYTLGSASVGDLDGFDLTEDGVALAFVAKYGDRLRYCHHTGKWYRWNGHIWLRDETHLAFSWARQVCRERARSGDDREQATLAKASTAAAVERFAQRDQRIAVTSALWDQDAFLLGTPGGTVDLRTGLLRTANPRDFITKAAAVAPAAAVECPLWLAFLRDATGGDEALITFLQRWCGYCLTGDTREHALLFGYGPGGNGKSVLLNTVAAILGTYATNAAMETFTASQGDRHPTDLAMLRGARLVTASETEEGRAWAEVRIKQLTGGDPITARFMRQDFFTFTPTFKLVVVGNHKPILRNVDDAARRRFNVVPFTHRPPRPDRELEAKLRQEWPGILRWMIEGCLAWQKDGLQRPKVVLDATAEYFSEQDAVRQWLEECCEITSRPPHYVDTTAGLFGSWRAFAQARGEEVGSAKRFNGALQRQGFTPIKDVDGIRGRGFRGLRVRLEAPRHWQDRDE